jgi:DnaJ-class molecular chaperone
LYFEIILSPTEALRGGLFPIQFPVIEHCSACSGCGQRGNLVCRYCDGNGVIQSEREFSLSIPPRTTHGTRVTLSMEDIGLRGVDLHLLISIDPFSDD